MIFLFLVVEKYRSAKRLLWVVLTVVSVSVLALAVFCQMPFIGIISVVFFLIGLALSLIYIFRFFPQAREVNKYGLSIQRSIILLTGIVSLLFIGLSWEQPGLYEAEEAQRNLVEVSKAQENYYSANNTYATTVSELGLDFSSIDLEVTSPPDGEPFYTASIDSKLFYNGGFAIQGNQNGLIATCESPVSCESGQWEINNFLPKEDKNNFIPPIDGSWAEDKRVDENPWADCSKEMENNPFSADSPNMKPNSCFRE